MSTPRAVLSATRARTVVELKELSRSWDALVFNVFFPVIFLFIFGSVFGDDIAPGVSFTQYFTAGMAASGVLLVSFQSLAISIAVERDDGLLKRLQGTPMPPVAYFLGKVGLVVVSGLVQLAVLLTAAHLLFDVTLPAGPRQWFTLAWVAVLGATAGTLLGIAYSSIPRTGRSASAVVAPVVLVLQFISGVFFVFSQLPGWMQDVASVFPLKWMAEGFRAALLPESMAAAEPSGSWQLGLVALVLLGWTVLGLVLCRTTFRWRRRGDR
ncbi:ABC transporter permease [Kineococcus gynurae]|uniref:Transport permease protein n=1 Tax=Kineococcus gynurae TaxID=452979 RepID=A0ABV5LN73_9ACTN